MSPWIEFFCALITLSDCLLKAHPKLARLRVKVYFADDDDGSDGRQRQ